MRITELISVADLRRCERIQRDVWNPGETEVVGSSHLRAVQHAGGLIAGAWRDDELVGFSYAFPAHRVGHRPAYGLHSHMTAVVPGARGKGVGRALKWFQRQWCLERNITWVEWTFDPLRSANARLNLEHLGATVGEYLVDAYGPMEDALNKGMPSDRLMAHWELESDAVSALAAGASRPPVGAAVPALSVSWEDPRADGNDELIPGEPRLELNEPAVSLRVPRDIGALMASAPERALAWRRAVREVMVHYLSAGYRATRFGDGGYLLERPPAV
jgi:chorismate synthase